MVLITPYKRTTIERSPNGVALYAGTNSVLHAYNPDGFAPCAVLICTLPMHATRAESNQGVPRA